MTKFQKQMLTIAAAGALTAVTALPAMAFENQFNGTFTLKTYLTNFDGTQPGGAQINLANTINTNGKTKANNYTDQRTRIMYTAKASDDLKLVTHFEIDTLWGNTASVPSTTGTLSNGGGGVDTDAINIKVKWAYLDFNIGKSLNFKGGQQAYKDKLKGLYVDADLPMMLATYKQGAYTLGLGYSRFNDAVIAGEAASGLASGKYASDLYVLDNTYAISKETNVGFSYYLNADYSAKDKTKNIHTFGVNGETKIGDLNLSGFAAMQAGHQRNVVANKSANYHGWAANVAAKMKAGSGTAKTGFLFTSGSNGDSIHNRGWQTLSAAGSTVTTGAGQNSYNESGMMLVVRNTSMGGTGTDSYLRKPITNIALATLGYDASLTEKLYANANVGFAWVPSSTNTSTFAATTTSTYNPNPRNNSSDFLGTEMNIELGYKMYKNLTLKGQAAYMVLGGYYKNAVTNNAGNNVDPANPYTMRLAASYAF